MRKAKFAIPFIRDQDGGVLVEAAVLIPILFVFLLGLVDFLNLFQQWNAAAKAVEVGARIAAVSDPVATGLTGSNNIAVQAVSDLRPLGSPMRDFEVTCNG